MLQSVATSCLLGNYSHALERETALHEELRASGRCFLDYGLNRALDKGTQVVKEYGKSVLGPRFQLVGDLDYSRFPGRSDLIGGLDAVIPVSAFFGNDAGGEDSRSALFFQQGATRWWDRGNSLHNDLRHGLVYRFRTSSEPGADILGLSMFHLANVEQGHEVVAPAVDYLGRWGSASLRYFSPTTDWRITGAGRMERALEGMEFALGADLTSAVRLRATGYRWEEEDGSGKWTHGVRLGARWQPHPWLHLEAGYDSSAYTVVLGNESMSVDDNSFSVRATFRMPLGTRSRPPRWEGLGLAAGGLAPRTTDLWRPAEGVGRIRVGTRATAESMVSRAEVRFVTDTLKSGEEVQLEVVLPAAAHEDIRIAVRLVPGSGDSPAVAGEDFVEEVVEVTIPAGAKQQRVSMRLLRNENLKENRSLGVALSVVSS